MCGLVGIVHPLSESRDFSLKSAMSHLAHRGPDGSGQRHLNILDWHVQLGHTRLAIIDLSSGGSQPLTSQDERFTLIFNGEIYNYLEIKRELEVLGYRFKSKSDAEVLLYAWIEWGRDSLKRLNGMFAFAVLDRTMGKLTCVRDAFGIKPLFWHLVGNTFAFASEIQALLDISRLTPAVNQTVMMRYLVTGKYDMGSATFFEGIARLRPGHLIALDLNRTTLVPTIEAWWQPRSALVSGISRDSAVALVRESLVDSVRQHLRSDVPLGIALSGGIDSSAIASIVRLLEPELPIHTFSYIAQGSEADEESWVNIINGSLGAIEHKLLLTQDDLERDLPELVAAQGEPFGGPSVYAQFRLYKLVREAGIKVVLDGQGADELFAGYPFLVKYRFRSMWNAGHFVDALRLLKKWSAYPGASSRVAIRLGFQSLLPTHAERWMLETRDRWRSRQFVDQQVLRQVWANDSGMSQLGTGRFSRRALSGRLSAALTDGELDSLLRHADRNSMHWSVESRVPFLSRDLADLALGLPESLLVSDEGISKSILRLALQGLVPNAVLSRRDKIGFKAPLRTPTAWLRRASEPDWLCGLEALPGIDSMRARSAVFASGNRRHTDDGLAWRLVNAAVWSSLFLR